MKDFAELFTALDRSTASSAKRAALLAYFRQASAADAAWAVYFLAGGKPRQLVPAKILRAAAQAASGLPAWLFDECYEAVGDLAETIALVLPPVPAAGSAAEPDAPDAPDVPAGPGLARLMTEQLLPLRGLSPEAQAARLQALWAGLAEAERLVAVKLITGNFRVGVSRPGLTRALAELAGVDASLLTQRLVGWLGAGRLPEAADWQALMQPAAAEGAVAPRGGVPYPFFLAQPLPRPADGDLQALVIEAALGQPADWQLEWKWDGIRAQVVKREGQAWLWTRGEDLVTPQYPELQPLLADLPDGTVLDGELLAWQGEAPLPFARLQQRLGRQRLTAAMLRDCPVQFMAYDLLEAQGVDLRSQPLARRRERLQALQHELPLLRLSPLLNAADWPAAAELRATARERGVEGLMLKALDSRYGQGRTREAGLWWKWKLDPFTVDAVLVYAQAGHGRRATLYTDYSFAVWSAPPGTPERQLLPVAKAYSGLSDAEIAEVDRFVRRHTLEKFGPVRSVQPELVFELGFEGIAPSPRHKSGVALRFPRMLRWRRDKPAEEADHLATLQALLKA